MMLVCSLLFKWMLGCAASVVAGALMWGLLSLASRRWPALQASRTAWLSALVLSAAAAALPLLPPADRFAALATLTVALPDESAQTRPDARVNTQPTTLAASGSADAPSARVPSTPAGAPKPALNAEPAPRADGIATPQAADAAASQALDAPALQAKVILSASALWLTIYATGLALAALKLLRARRLWRGLLATAQRLSAEELAMHGAFNNEQLEAITQRELAVFETSAAISPMLIGLRQPRLLLPAHLRAMSTEQQQMIIHHELRHWRQRDPLCLGIAAFLQTALWFNPALRWLSRAMEWAMELSCDQHVLAGRPQQQRKQYAAALLQQWQAQTGLRPAGGIAFGGIDGATVASRLRWMQQTRTPALTRHAAWLVAAAMAAVIAATAALQPALAFSKPADAANSAMTSAGADGTPASLASPAGPEVWRYPLDQMRVTSFFGVTRDVMAGPHHGIDLKAASGTPVHAAASGTVISAGPLAEHDGRYGIAVIIDHGARRSLYAHLSSVAVQPGAKVAAGQLIGASGGTGFATGPHLHFEVRVQNQPVDPATQLAGLDVHATPRALRVRRQQYGY